VAAGTISDLAGTPPGARFLAAHKDRLVAASADTDTPNRIYFSGAGNAESWDTTNRYIDTSAPVIGIAALRNALVVFHEGSVERIRGDIPPGSAAANMTLEPLFGDVGLWDANAVTVADDFAYFADENGVYRTDGTSFTDLTKQGGIERLWREDYMGLSPTGMAIGVWRGYLFTAFPNIAVSLVCELSVPRWVAFSNVKANNFATQYGSTDELYFSNQLTTTKRAAKLSSVFAPTAAVKNDADGTAVLPFVATQYIQPEKGLTRWKRVFISYDMRDAASDNPVITVRYLPGPTLLGAPAGTTVVGTLAETSAFARKRLPVGRTPHGASISLEQTVASSETCIYSIEIEGHPQEGSRL
jgi:hypothetical protein